MPRANWLKIRNEYIMTDIAQRPLAQKYNIGYSTLAQRATKENWAELRKQHLSKVDAKVEQRLDKLAETKAKVIIDYNAEHLRVWNLLLGKIDALIVQGVNTDDVPKLSAALEKTQKGQRLALGESTENTEVKHSDAKQLLTARIDAIVNRRRDKGTI